MNTYNWALERQRLGVWIEKNQATRDRPIGNEATGNKKETLLRKWGLLDWEETEGDNTMWKANGYTWTGGQSGSGLLEKRMRKTKQTN